MGQICSDEATWKLETHNFKGLPKEPDLSIRPIIESETFCIKSGGSYQRSVAQTPPVELAN